MIENLPQLQILDGLDKEGRTAVVDEILADIPGLDQYLEYLVSSSSSVSLPLSLHKLVQQSCQRKDSKSYGQLHTNMIKTLQLL